MSTCDVTDFRATLNTYKNNAKLIPLFLSITINNYKLKWVIKTKLFNDD